MITSDEEFIAIVQAAASPDDFSHPRSWSARSIASGPRISRSLREDFPERLRIRRPVWANDLREMLAALAKIEFSSRSASPLHKLCECAARYGSQELEATVSSELLAMLSQKARAGLESLLGSHPIDKIIDLRSGMSDPHNGGRTVTLVRCKGGSIIYKPRPGYGEREWFTFVRYLNTKGIRPNLRAAKVLCRDGYCWMEKINYAPCKDHATARRFYERLGATIA